MTKPIYLDYMSTTPVDERVIDVMLPLLGKTGTFGNPSSITHCYGQSALQVVDNAREHVAALLDTVPSSIIFTSGATEASNLAIIGGALFYPSKGRHLITLKTEHKATLDSMAYLETLGFEVSYLTPNPDGIIDIDVLCQAIRPNTLMVSIMWVNNEIGVIQPIEKIAQLLKSKGILLHVDAAQAVGKLPISLKNSSIDYLSISSHKIYGPKGVGALYLRQKPAVWVKPLSFGGGQERGLRSGTLPTHQIAGFGKACEILLTTLDEETKRMHQLHTHLWQGIRHLPNIQLNGSSIYRVPHNLNVTFKGLDGQTILLALHELAVSTTSACLAKTHQPSHVLEAIGLSRQDALSSVRLSLGRYTTCEEIELTIAIVCKQMSRLYDMVP